jgi:hypothetical protein
MLKRLDYGHVRTRREDGTIEVGPPPPSHPDALLAVSGSVAEAIAARRPSRNRGGASTNEAST